MWILEGDNVGSRLNEKCIWRPDVNCSLLEWNVVDKVYATLDAFR